MQMAKRFTDSEKWQDEWWGSLSNDYRMVWLYLVDRCSPAGIWKKDFRGLNFNCNTSITENDFKDVFKSRVIDLDTFYFLPKFLRFQYPMGLNSEKPAIVSVRKELKLNNLYQTVRQSLGNDYLIVKDKDKDMDKDKDTDKAIDINGVEFFDESIKPSIIIKDGLIGLRMNMLETYIIGRYGEQNVEVLQMQNGCKPPYDSFLKEKAGNIYPNPEYFWNSFKKFWRDGGSPGKKISKNPGKL